MLPVPRRRAERALLSVVQEAYVAGVSTRRVEDLVEALGIASLSKSEVSRVCAALDSEVAASRNRSPEDERYPYLWLDATYVKVREAGRVVSMAVLVAVGVAATGERRVLGLELAAGNDEGNAWAPFLRALVERGLAGVRLVISDAHRGLVVAVRETLLGAAWQRCRVHFSRNAQGLVPRGAAGMVASAVRSIFEQLDESAASGQLRRVEQRIDTTYFPDQQVAEVRVEPGGVQLWVELDDGRAALIGRYIELGRAGLLSEEPSILDVFAAERRLNGAGTPVEVDGRALMPDEIAAFWNIVASEDWPEIAVTIGRAGAKPYTGEAAASDERFEAMVYGYPEFTRLIFTAPDGRHVELAYYQVTSVIVGMPMAWANAPSGRGFKVPEAVAGSFALALGVEPPAIEPSTVGVSDGSTGSVQVGRGRASNVVAAAVVGVGVLAALATAGALVRAGRMTQA